MDSISLSEGIQITISIAVIVFAIYFFSKSKWWKEHSGSIGNRTIAIVYGIFKFIFKGIGVIIVIALLVWLAPKVIDFLTPDTWTLFVCETKLNEFECMDNKYVIPDFKSKKDCLLEGATNFSKEGFECGSNCRTEYGLNICKEVCNSLGCHH